ncbi:type II secretion system protein [Vibrio genomosp. F6]|uniref:MSHA biogenesis protein MshA n=1 Tax=Vibrio genomosp. F6 str. FF-238 TaxID=1191298 RepID=A0A1E5D7D7_9VIBR|nr:type II secretion system protein [Vibrio genomosp. F6]OEE79580.1 MSHA biogenesis protein MshA [Vibrio genomosp. F6 str. FF-238]TKF17897.1 type II secretion system protein [Vibrio genomosp. F6]
MKKNNGFTLIELVVVIVILGILAVTAAPRFLNLQTDARNARLEGMKGAIEGALAIGYGKMAIEGLEHLRYVSNINADGKTPKHDLPFTDCNIGGSESCTFIYGYPDADSTSLRQLVQELATNDSDWIILRHPDGDPRRELFVTVRGETDMTACAVRYAPPTSTTPQYQLEVLPCL